MSDRYILFQIICVLEIGTKKYDASGFAKWSSSCAADSSDDEAAG